MPPTRINIYPPQLGMNEIPPPEGAARQNNEAFDQWYAQWANKAGINPNPDDPEQKYDYRAAFAAGVEPKIDPTDGKYHWDSRFKAADHPNRFVNGVDTITGKPPAMPTASDALPALLRRYGGGAAAGLVAAVPSGILNLAALPGDVGDMAGWTDAEKPSLMQRSRDNLQSLVDSAAGIDKSEHGLGDTFAQIGGAIANPITPAITAGRGAVNALVNAGKQFLVPGTKAGPGYARQLASNEAIAGGAVGGLHALMNNEAQAAEPPKMNEIPQPGGTARATDPFSSGTINGTSLGVNVIPPVEQPHSVLTHPAIIGTIATAAALATAVLARKALGPGGFASGSQTPATASNWAKGWQQAFRNTAPWEELVSRSGLPKDSVENMNATIRLRSFGGPQNGRIAEPFNNGTFDALPGVSLTVLRNGRQMSLGDMMREASALPADVQAGIDKALAYGTELDNRRRLMAGRDVTPAHLAQPPVPAGQAQPPLAPGQARVIAGQGVVHYDSRVPETGMVNWRSVPTAQMEAEYNALMNDPKIGSFVNSIYAFTPKVGEVLYQADKVSRVELNKILNANPRYQHELGTSPLIQRQLNNSPGAKFAEEKLGQSLQGTVEGFVKTLQAADENIVHQYIVKLATDMDRLTPGAPKIVNRITAAEPAGAEASSALVYHVNGNKRYAIFNDPTYAAVAKTNSWLANSFFGGINKIRGTAQSMITGAPSMAMGNVFGPVAAIMTGQTGAALRPAGHRLGFIDSALQELTGGKVGLVGDPTIMLQTAGHMTTNLVNEARRQLSNGIHASLDANTWASQTFPIAFRRAWADRMAQAYEDSALGQLRAAGGGGSGLSRDADKVYDEGTRIGRDYLRNTASGINNGTIPATAKAAWRSFAAFHNVLTESAATAAWKQNPQLPTAQRAQFARSMSGDPAERGSNVALGALSTPIPYFQVAWQAMGRIVEEASKGPAEAAKVFGGMLVMPAALSLFYQMYLANLGPQYAKDYFNDRTPEDRASGRPMYLPGQDPKLASRIPIANEHAPISALFDHLWGDVLGTTTGVLNAPYMMAINDRLNTNTINDLWAAFKRVSPVTPGSDPISGTASVLLGISPSSIGRYDASPIAGSKIANEGEDKSRYIGGPWFTHAKIEEFMGLFGAVSQQIFDASKNAWYGGTTKAADVAQGFGRNAVEKNQWIPFLRQMADQGKNQSSMNLDGKLLQDYDKKLKALTDDWHNRDEPFAQRKAGIDFTGASPVSLKKFEQRLMAEGDVKGAQDAFVTAIYLERLTQFRTSDQYSHLSKERSQLLENMARIRSSETRDPATRQRQMSENSADIARNASDQIALLEYWQATQKRDPLIAPFFVPIQQYRPGYTLGGRRLVQAGQ